MAATFSLERVRHHIIPAVASLVGLGVAIGIVTVPSDVLNAAVDRGGFATVLPAAASPIGATGRTLIALLAGLLIAACGFAPQLKAMLVERVDAFARRPRAAAPGEEDAPIVRRADAHPDAPPRRPIRAASDLGDPLPIFGEEDRRSAPLPPPLERSLPDDLDRPLADFDPAAVPLRPMAPPEPVAPLAWSAEPSPAVAAVVPPVAESVVSPAAPRFAWLAPEEVDEPMIVQATSVEDRPRPIIVPTAEAEPTEAARVPTFAQPESRPAEPPMPHQVAADEVATAHEPLPTRAEADAIEPPVPPFKSAAAEPLLPPQPLTRHAESFPAEARPAVPLQNAATTTPRAVKPPAPEPIEDESIAGLLARLERGAAQRRIVATPPASPASAPPPVASAPATPPPAPDAGPVSLDETLQRLRRLAAN
ncbi:hypothetical protein HRV97_06660 [Sphingomonas sp. HHU CXW]|uniref:Uncharacterized protein n=1 Tax=Sphingomonas hominis TaxID=2741495 RepID=A0ABX2JFC4_9SPHN|nr:hypothetical protein [Sphingomonas hominis]NTS64838.1 hypothetical protein [Sphingomonas hominis]